MEEEETMKKKARTFTDYWLAAKWLYVAPQGHYLNNEAYFSIQGMCRNAYNAGRREGKKKRPKAVKP